MKMLSYLIEETYKKIIEENKSPEELKNKTFKYSVLSVPFGGLLAGAGLVDTIAPDNDTLGVIGMGAGAIGSGLGMYKLNNYLGKTPEEKAAIAKSAFIGGLTGLIGGDLIGIGLGDNIPQAYGISAQIPGALTGAAIGTMLARKKRNEK
jgi:hypothetical protein